MDDRYREWHGALGLSRIPDRGHALELDVAWVVTPTAVTTRGGRAAWRKRAIRLRC